MTDWRWPEPVTLSPILSHALAAFHENGYHGASVRDIAQRVGVTIPALYYHHQNKEAMLAALLDASIERFVTLSDAALCEAGDDPARCFLVTIECAVRHMTQSRKLAVLAPEARSLSPEARANYNQKRREVELRVRSVVADACNAGLLSTPVPNATARALLSMLRGIPVWYRADGDATVDEIVRHYQHITACAAGATAQMLRKIPAPTE